MRNFVRESIEEALEATGYKLEELSPLESIFLRNKVSNKFTNKEETDSLFWESLTNSFDIRDKDAWKWLDEFIQLKEFYLYFDKSSDSTVYIFPENQSFTKFLSEFPGYVFYITNENLDFLICFNDSHYLIALGTAESWLRNKTIELSKSGWVDMDGRSFS